MDDVNTEFCAEYHHDGATWGLNIFAKDAADALVKIESLKASLRLLGPLVASVDVKAEITSADIVASTRVH